MLSTERKTQNVPVAPSVKTKPTTLGPMTEDELIKGFLDGSIPSTAYDTACTLKAGMPGDPYIQTGTPSTKIFALANDYAIPGSNVVKLYHDVREPEHTVDMVPSLTNN